jgi:hypothetical protein
MKKNDVKSGGVYLAKVTDKVVSVRLDAENPHGGWDATNLTTGKKVRIKSAQRLRGPAKGKKTAGEQAMEKADDDDRCATPRCKGEPTMIYHDKPLCRKCWDRVAANVTQDGDAPRSELTAEESDKLAKVRKAKKEKADKPKRVSALDAAAEVLKASDAPMRAKEMVEAMAAQGLWSSPNGKTPEATLYSAIIREIGKAVESGTISRFRKTERGMFTYNAEAK